MIQNLSAFDIEQPSLSDVHRRHLKESGISDEVIAEARCHTADTKALLTNIGFPNPKFSGGGLAFPFFGLMSERPEWAQIRPDSPRIDAKGDKLRKYEVPFGQKIGIYAIPSIRDALGDPEVPLWITEGIKKALAGCSHGLCCIALLGVTLHVGKNSRQAVADLADWGAITWKGPNGPRTVYIAFDSDMNVNPNVAREAAKLGRKLEARGARVLYVNIPSAPDGSKMGLDDALARGVSPEKLAATATENPPHMPKKSDNGLPDMVCSGRQIQDAAKETIECIRASSRRNLLFYKDGMLVELRECKEDELEEHLGKMLFKSEPQCSSDHIHKIACDSANWYAPCKDGDYKASSPPRDVLSYIRAYTAKWELAERLEGIASGPIMAKDGTFAKGPGYDDKTKWYIKGDGDWPDWPGDGPSAASWLINEILADFPFRDQASKANALALILAPFVIYAIEGNMPLFWVEAPKSRTGKSILAQACMLPYNGDIIGGPQIGDDEEMKKSLYARFSRGLPYVFFDNLKVKLDSPTLEACLTSESIPIRLLSTNTETTFRVDNTLFLATTNNGECSIDLAGRRIVISLLANEEFPENRSGFNHDPLHAWIAANRKTAVSAAMGMVAHWVSQGRPMRSPYSLGGRLDCACKTLGGILESCGVEGFMSNYLSQKEAASADKSEIVDLYEAWHEMFGSQPVSVSQLMALADERKLVPSWFGSSDPATRRKFGHCLNSLRDCINGGFVHSVLPRQSKHKGSPTQYVLKQKWGDMGSNGEFSISPHVRNDNIGNLFNAVDKGCKNTPYLPITPQYIPNEDNIELSQRFLREDCDDDEDEAGEFDPNEEVIL